MRLTEKKTRQHEWLIRNREKAREATRKWRSRQDKDELREKNNLTRRAWMSIPENRIKHSMGQAKRRAKSKDIAFSITINDLFPLPTHCPVFGIVLNYSGSGSKRGFVSDSPSIDRIDSTKGYVPGNVRVISWRANRIKADATVTELKMILAYFGEA